MPREDGYKNLVPFSERTVEEARALGKKGGIESGVARRRKKSLKEAADLFLSLPVSDKRTRNKIARCGVDPEDIDNQMAMVIGLTLAATSGDARAGRLIADLLGDDPREGVPEKENNLMDAIKEATKEGINTDDIPEIKQKAAADDGMVERSEPETP